jgi:hypothetical protein
LTVYETRKGFEFLRFIKYGVKCYRNLQFAGNIVSCVTGCNVEGYLADGHSNIWKHTTGRVSRANLKPDGGIQKIVQNL